MSSRKEILVVEDQEETRLFLSQVLKDHGYECRSARNGDEAIAALKQKRPDLVLLDIMMPRKGGIYVFQSMKNDQWLAEVPVIVVTGMSEATGVDLKSGAEAPIEDDGDVIARVIGSLLREKVQGLVPDGLVEKPVKSWELVAKIENLLS